MTDRRSSVFLDDRPDSRPRGVAPEAPPAPVTLGEIAGAQWTLGRQDFVGAPEQAEVDAYGPVITALYDRAPKNMLGFTGKTYLMPAGTKANIAYDKVWSDVAAYRRDDPTFLKDVPAANADEFKAWVQAQEQSRRRQAQDVVRREDGVGQKAFGFGVGVATGMVDPVNLSAMLLTGGAGAAPSIWRGMAREALINGAIEAAELPAIAANRAQFGEDMGAGDMAVDLALAAAGGAAFHAGARGLAAGGRAIVDSAAGKAVGQALTPLALRGARLSGATDGEVARAFGDALPAELRTPDQQAALHVLTREADVDASNPFVANAAGQDAHAARLDEALRAMLMPDARRGNLAASTALASGTVLPSAPRPASSTPDLSPDRVIRFVINDLEGGAAVVRYGDADGGTTKYGIAAKFNPGVDVAGLTEAQAASIARRKYWFPELNRADPRTAAVAFDAGYIAGPAVGRRVLRESGGDPARALAIYRDFLNGLADSKPGKAKYRRGWNARVDRLARMVGSGEDRVQLDPTRFGEAAADDVAIAQRQLDHATMDAELLAAERARSDRQIAPERQAGADDIGPMEGSALLDDAAQADGPAPATAGITDAAAPAATPDAPTIEPTQIDPEARAAVRRYVSDTRGSLQPAKIAKALGMSADDADRIVLSLVGDPRSGLVQIGRPGQGKGLRIVRRPERRAPVDLMRFLADRGGLRDDEGHALTGAGGTDRGLSRFVPGSGPLFREGGMSLDRARELAAEAGYFHDRSPDDAVSDTTTADFIDLLHQADAAPLYTRGDLDAAAAREAEAAATEQARQVREWIDARLTEHGFAFDRDQQARAAALMIERDMEPDEAIRTVVNQDIAEALDDARMEADSDRYDLLADDIERTLAESGRGPDGRDTGWSADVGNAREGGAGAGEPARGAEGGAARDAREAAGLEGPAPLNGGRGFDDPDGPAAVAVVDSLLHDLRAELDAVLPNDPSLQEFRIMSPVGVSRVVDREGARRAAMTAARRLGVDERFWNNIMRYDGGEASFGPLRIVEGNAELLNERFGAPYASDYRIDVDGVERSLRDVLDEIEADDAAIKAARACL